MCQPPMLSCLSSVGVGGEEQIRPKEFRDPLPSLDASHVPYRRAASYVISQLEAKSIALPRVGIVCGSGLSSLSQTLDATSAQVTIPYGDIPGFPASCGVVGHAGELVVGTLHGIGCICFRGRFHSYEGHDMNTVVLPVRVMRALGVRLVVVTNAAGGLKGEYNVGDVAVIRDHIALPLMAGKNPLVGKNDDELGPRFPPTSNLYDSKLQDIVVSVAEELDFGKHLHTDACYAFVSGPNYESKSECNMLRLLGADAVGMSTVPEVLAAHHSGMAVLCLSLITNKVVFDEPGDDAAHANHEEVLEAVKGRGEQMVLLVKEVVRRCGEDYIPKLDDLRPICLETKSRLLGNDRKSRSMKTAALGGVIFAAGALVGMKMSRAAAT